MAWRNYQGKQGGQKGEGKDGKGQHRWQYWQGSWSPSQRANGPPWKRQQQRGQDSGKAALSFPGYDAAQKDPAPISEMASSKENGGDGYASALQRAINSVRRAENRSRKAIGDKQARTTQWNNWVMEMKRAYAKEKGRYQATLSRLDRELEEAQLEQESARAALRTVASSMEVDTYGSLHAMPEATEAGHEFDSLMQEEAVLEEPQESNADILRRTLQQEDVKRMQSVFAGSLPAAATTPTAKIQKAYSLESSTPLHGTRTQLPRTGHRLHPASTPQSPGTTPAGSDPYMVSPSITARRASPPLHGRRKSATPDGAGREGLKAATKPMAPKHVDHPTQSLADKLEARRAQLDAASKDGNNGDGKADNLNAPQVPVVPQQHLLYDDEDDHDLSEHSDLEMWYKDKYGNGDLQKLE